MLESPLTMDRVTTSKSNNALNCQFYSVFTDEDLLSIPSPTSSFPSMPNTSFNVEGIYKLLNGLDATTVKTKNVQFAMTTVIPLTTSNVCFI